MIEKATTVRESLPTRADRIVRQLTDLSLSQVAGLFDHGCVLLNGELCPTASTTVQTGDQISVKYDEHRRYRPKAQPWSDPAFEIIFEDRELIVVNKTAGVLTVPAGPGGASPLSEALSSYVAHRSGHGRAHVVHRLDRGVSGVIVFAKSREIADLLQRQFEQRKPERQYVAIVKGAVQESGTFRSHLATSASLQRFSVQRPENGELAITHYKLEKIVRGCSVVRVWLETGRRNQIRVHFAECGHPVLGDERYRPDLSSHPAWRVKRLALHAATLAFTHPVSGETLRFEAPLPAAMLRF